MLENVDKLWLGGNENGRLKTSDKQTGKFNRVAKIQKMYSEIDEKLRRFCSIERNTERKACAFAVLMMIETGIRIGNEDSSNGYVSKAKKTEGQTLYTYGLTTLKKEHVEFTNQNESIGNLWIEHKSMILKFVGKKSVYHEITITDSFLVKVGEEFYKAGSERWLNYDNQQEVTDNLVANFIKKSIGHGFSPKDFRAFRANIEAARLSEKILKEETKELKTKKSVNQEIKKIVTEVSHVLGNTPGIAKKAYINVEILNKHINNFGWEIVQYSRKKKIKEKIQKLEIKNA
jgi:DNA topoisomerase IB